MGRQLSEARQRRNLTLADISRTTKIPVHFLEAIERNDIDHLPHGFFTRAFVRAYANEVGVTPEIEPIETQLPIPNVTVAEPASSRALIFVLALGAACGVYLGFASRTPHAEEPQVEITEPAQPADRAEAVATTVPPATADVVFQIQSQGGCVVAVTADGRPVASGPNLPGQPLTVKARGEIILRVGDTSACATSTPIDSAMRVARQPPPFVPVADVVVAGTAPKRSLAKSVAADDPAVLASPPALESTPAIVDVAIPSPDEAPPPTLVEQF